MGGCCLGEGGERTFGRKGTPLVVFLLGGRLGLGIRVLGVVMHRIILNPPRPPPPPFPFRLCNKGNFLKSPTPSPPQPCEGGLGCGNGKQIEKHVFWKKCPFQGKRKSVSLSLGGWMGMHALPIHPPPLPHPPTPPKDTKTLVPKNPVEKMCFFQGKCWICWICWMFWGELGQTPPFC